MGWICIPSRLAWKRRPRKRFASCVQATLFVPSVDADFTKHIISVWQVLAQRSRFGLCQRYRHVPLAEPFTVSSPPLGEGFAHPMIFPGMTRTSVGSSPDRNAAMHGGTRLSGRASSKRGF